MSGYLKINGVSVKPPQELQVSHQTIDADSTGRNANGDMVRDIIAKKVKIDCVWGPLSNNEIKTLLNAVDRSFFSVTYPDPQKGITTKTFYVGDRTAPVYSLNPKFNKIMWQNLSMNFVER